VKLLIRVVVTIGMAGLLMGLCLAIVGLTAQARPADVAIVFGSKVEPTGRPSPRLKARLDAARELFGSGKVRRIIVSGGTGKEGFDESAVMKAYLVGAGVPGAAVYADGRGVNTERTCADARTLMESHGLRRADVVTQYFHVARATLACRRAGIEVVGAVAPRYFEPRDVYSLAREVVAFPVYYLRVR
jgi:vancomycin permeability regulator SanA